MDDFNVSREDYPLFRQGLQELANAFVGKSDAESERRLKNCLEILDEYCVRCGARLRKPRARRCRHCWAEQTWARN
jgi:hypothetical protein